LLRKESVVQQRPDLPNATVLVLVFLILLALALVGLAWGS